MPLGMLPLLFAFVAPEAGAAQMTDLPPRLRGDAGITYRFGRLSGGLVEDGTKVGSRLLETHEVLYGGVFSVGPGIGVFAEAEQVALERVSFPSANRMAYDPSGVHAGTMVGTDPLEPLPMREGSGFQGVWLGLRGTPFSEAFPRRKNRATWMLEAAWRTANATPFWTVSGGSRGAGEGGNAWRVATAFSTRKGAGEPYMGASWTHTGPFTTNLQDAAGAVTAEGVELDGPDVLDIRSGIEFVAGEKADGRRLGIDLGIGVTYRTWEVIPSGILLPETLALTRSTPVTGAEATSARAGLAFHWRVLQAVQVDLGGNVGWVVPHAIEHPYPVLTGSDTLDLQVFAGLKARGR